jgi:imidazolonepropionase-like amidohydrolase
MAHGEAFARGERREYAASRLDLEALARVVRGDMPLVVSVHRASDIESVLRFAAEQRLRIVLTGASEAWMVAPAIAAAGVPVVLNPLANLPERFEALGSTLTNAKILHGAGVVIAFMSGEAHNARNVRQAAGNAVAHGLPWEAALAALTANPAKIWGVSATCGTLEIGKDADLVVWSGDALEVTSAAELVFIAGVEIPLESRQSYLARRYLRPGGDPPPAYR